MKFPEWMQVVGDQSFRGECPKEGAEQKTFFNTLRREYPEIGRIALHPKNEGRRTHGQVQNDKAMGMVTGAADVVIPAGRTVLIEIKRLDHTQSKWQEGQLAYLEAAHRMGADVYVALGADAALSIVKKMPR